MSLFPLHLVGMQPQTHLPIIKHPYHKLSLPNPAFWISYFHSNNRYISGINKTNSYCNILKISMFGMVSALVSMMDSLSSVSWYHMVEGEDQRPQVVLWPLYM